MVYRTTNEAACNVTKKKINLTGDGAGTRREEDDQLCEMELQVRVNGCRSWMMFALHERAKRNIFVYGILNNVS